MRRQYICVAVGAISMACSKGSSSDARPLGFSPPDKDAMANASMLRDEGASGTATWPPGTQHLAEGKKIRLAVDHGVDLIAAAEGELLRVPKDGSATTVLASFPATEIQEMGVTASYAFVATFPVNPETAGVKAEGRLVAIPLAGGAPVEIDSTVNISVHIAGTASGAFVGMRHSLAFVPDAAPTDAVVVAQTQGFIDGVAADSAGVVWLEDNFRDVERRLRWLPAPPSPDAPSASATSGSVRPPRRSRSDAGTGGVAAPRELGKVAAYGDSIRLDATSAFALRVKLTTATAPGGATYYEDVGGVLAVDRATGLDSTLADGLMNARDLAAASGSLCVSVWGPKLEFAKNGTLLAVPKSGGEPRRLATGLPRPQCLAADSTSFFVTAGDRSGVSRVPL